MFVAIVQLVLMTMGAVSGYGLIQSIGQRVFADDLLILMTVIGILIGCGIGFVFGGVFGRFLLKTINNAAAYIQKMPTTDLVLAIIGLIAGFVIAALLSLVLSKIEFFGIYLSVLSFVIFGYMGLQLAIRKRGDFSNTLSAMDTVDQWDAKAVLIKGMSTATDKIVDTSSIIDGRIQDISKTGFLEGRLLIPRFVLNELQLIADSDDSIKRSRGRRGLTILEQLRHAKEIKIQIVERDYNKPRDVDSKLVKLAQELNTVILTTDYNLNKVASLQGVTVLNVNDLANAIKPLVLPGERLEVKVIKQGKESGQGVGYLEDGTMIVVEDGGSYLGTTVEGIVTSVLQTPAGRMVFVRVQGARISSA